MILQSIFEGHSPGYYVDIGAHHPFRLSNTHAFYRRGWNGINIDATPGSMKAFRRHRRRDVNIEAALSDQREQLSFCRFNEPALNGFETALSQQIDGSRCYRVIERIELKTRMLQEVLDEFLPVGQRIDFLSVDVEGFDLRVLRSNNWERFHPSVVLVEAQVATIEELATTEIHNFMQEKGYTLCAKTKRTVFYADERFLAA